MCTYPTLLSLVYQVQASRDVGPATRVVMLICPLLDLVIHKLLLLDFSSAGVIGSFHNILSDYIFIRLLPTSDY